MFTDIGTMTDFDRKYSQTMQPPAQQRGAHIQATLRRERAPSVRRSISDSCSASEVNQVPMVTVDSAVATHKGRKSKKGKQEVTSITVPTPTHTKDSGYKYRKEAHSTEPYTDNTKASKYKQRPMSRSDGFGEQPPLYQTASESGVGGGGYGGGVGNFNGSLRRQKGRSSQSLCSCDADTEVIPDPLRPLYEYSLDRSRPTHTYTCEQNAQILMRLDKERQRKTGSTFKLEQQHSGIKSMPVEHSVATLERSRRAVYPEKMYYADNFYPDADLIPPPPTPPIYRNPSYNPHHFMSAPPPPPPPPQVLKATTTTMTAAAAAAAATVPATAHAKGNSTTTTSNLDCTNSILKCAASATITTSGAKGVKPDLCDFPVPGCEKSKCNVLQQQHHDELLHGHHLNAGGHTGGMELTADSGGHHYNHHNMPNYYHIFADDGGIFHCAKPGDDGSLVFFHHEPATVPTNVAQQLHNYDGLSMMNADKCNTIGPSTTKYHHFKGPIDRIHSSTCNLNQFVEPVSLSNGRYFSNSLSNFSFAGPHMHHFAGQQPPYTQFHNGSSGGMAEATLIMPDTFKAAAAAAGGSIVGGSASLNGGGTPKQQQRNGNGTNGGGSGNGNGGSGGYNMPWRHRQCPSRGSSSSATSSGWDLPSRHWLAVTSILLIAGAAGVAVPFALRVTAGAPFEERVAAATQLLETVPLIDGHNDLPWNIRKFLHNQLNDFRFDEDLRTIKPWATSTWSHTDLPRMQRGRISAQFWAAYVPCEAQHRDAVQLIFEQIDLIKRLTEKYAPTLTMCTSVSDIVEAHKNHQMCSLTGVEGGHSLGGSLGILRIMYAVGVRYVTLTSTCHTPWADSSSADAPKFDVKHGGLTPFGKTIVREMNRLGIIIDLSHTSIGTMRDAINVSEAPVIFSHSSAYALCENGRNVNDDILQLVAKNHGLVMVNFYSRFLSCKDNATINDAVAHINHIRGVAGIDSVGIGAGFDGINYTPRGLEDVSSYPMLFAELMGDGWTAEELAKLAGHNFLRVMNDVERVRDEQRTAKVLPHEETPSFRSDDPYNCTTS